MTARSEREQLAIYCDALYGAEPAGAFLEVRYKQDGGMGQMWLPVDQPRIGFDAIERMGRSTDVYVGVAPRRERDGTRAGIDRIHVCWADCDSPESVAALGDFDPAPALTVCSGTEGHLHAYWPLWPPAGPDAIERANRRLAHALGADSATTDAPRILRPPGTFNHKGAEPRPVTLEHVEHEVYALADIAGDLPDPIAPADELAPKRKRPAEGDALAGALSAIPPAEYIARLAGRTPDRAGKVRCPFHGAGQERTPSLHAYANPEQGWTCFGGCEGTAGKRNGGDVFTFAAQLWQLDPREDFAALRERLAAELLGEPMRAAA